MSAAARATSLPPVSGAPASTPAPTPALASTARRAPRVTPGSAMTGAAPGAAGWSANTSAPWNPWRWVRRHATPALGRHTRRGYIPDLAAHRRWDAEVLQTAHPASHVWVYAVVNGRSTKVCSFCGYAQPRRIAQVQVDTDALVTGPVWVIVDRLAAFDADRVALLAGPFWDQPAVLAASDEYRYSDVEALRKRVTPAQFRILARGGPAGTRELFDVVGPGCSGGTCGAPSEDVDTGRSTPGFPVAP